MDKKSHIVVAIPGSDPEQFLLDGGRIGIGRGADNQVPLDHDGISGTHCEFRQTDDGGYAIVDLDSSNGTRVNGDKISEPTVLSDGDRVLLAETVPVYFYLLEEGEEAPNVSASSDPETRETAAALASMGEKIAAMKAQEAELAAGIKLMKEEFEERQTEVAALKGKIDGIETDLGTKRKEGASTEEIEKLEEELFTQTRRWKLMASDLEGQQAQLESLGAKVPGGPAPTTPGAPTGAPLAAQPATNAAPSPPPAKPAPVATPPLATSPLVPTPSPATPAASTDTPAKTTPPAPNSPSAAATTPSVAASPPPAVTAPAAAPPAAPTGPPTVQLQKSVSSGPPTVQLTKGTGDAPVLKKQADSDAPPKLNKG